MRRPSAVLRSASALLVSRIFRRSKRPRLHFLSNVYKDYKALRPKGRRSLLSALLVSKLAKSAFSNTKSVSKAVTASLKSPSTSTDNAKPNSLASKMNSAPSPPRSPPPGSRRQRLLGLARATRDTYIPRLASSVTQLTGSRAVEPGTPFPPKTQFTLFPSYTRPHDSGYVVTVRGWMWCPGLMTRRNRLILSLAKQITRYGDAAAVSKLEDPLLDLDADLLDSDAASTISSRSQQGDQDAVIRERLAAFIARSIPSALLLIVVGAREPQQLIEIAATTDANGHFEAEVQVPYDPSVVLVAATADETVYAFQEVKVVSSSGLGVISDIDDTVKLTGVIGDKRELMKKLLTGEVLSWNIAPVVAWYNEILSKPDVTFHYVSNLPWQLFSLIHQYFDAVKLPPGLFHLKQYTGNIMASLMEPSLSRKKRSLFKIVEDFPNKTFICVGDLGELDMEAYADLAKCYPGRVHAIYIRVVPDLLSDVNDDQILSELRWMLAESSRRAEAKPRPPQSDPSEPDLIDLSSPAGVREARLPPLIPKKPAALRGNQMSPPLPARKTTRAVGEPSALDKATKLDEAATKLERQTADARKPQAPHRVQTLPILSHAELAPPPPLPRRTATTPLAPATPNAFEHLPTGSYYELEDTDSRGALWLERLSGVLHDLEGTGTTVHFFEDKDEEFFKDQLQNLE